MLHCHRVGQQNEKEKEKKKKNENKWKKWKKKKKEKKKKKKEKEKKEKEKKKKKVIIERLLKKFEDFCTTTKLDSTRNSEHKNIYILPKLKPGSLPLATELHQPGNHF